MLQPMRLSRSEVFVPRALKRDGCAMRPLAELLALCGQITDAGTNTYQ